MPASVGDAASETHDNAATMAECTDDDCCGLVNAHLALRAQRESEKRLVHDRRILVLYGSETGNGALTP